MADLGRPRRGPHLTAPLRAFAIEQRPIGPARKRYGVQPDDKARIDGALRNLRDMPRDVIINREEVINFVHKQAAVIQAVADGLKVLQPAPVRERRADPKARAEAVFVKPAPRQDTTREIIVAKGRRVRVLERGTVGQMELGL